MLSKHEESYLKKYFQIAEVISEFSMWLLRYSEYIWMYASLNVKVVPVGHFKSLQLLAVHIKTSNVALNRYFKDKASEESS